ncbi:GNAT family N-acetyltransferase [Candidatus Laterigemmans baculatus]|uniref:GNAT family N-acetyltransferase n=1 Tax=Candidatus Laterigemmans baculatus TaxID=2770505 RepID=UPI0013DD0A40|nr:GNAT family N-acetyltransferase [Candidatus Laterigemmans baculatus]
MIRIEHYQEADLEGLVSLFTSAVHILGASHYEAAQLAAWAPQPPDLEQWRVRLAAVETLVARIDSALAGFVSFEWNGHIDLLFTSPHHARRGVASRLLNMAEEAVAAEKAPAMFTEASLIARPFFIRHGYQVVEEQLVMRRGVTLRRFAMRKSLAEPC